MLSNCLRTDVLYCAKCQYILVMIPVLAYAAPREFTRKCNVPYTNLFDVGRPNIGGEVPYSTWPNKQMMELLSSSVTPSLLSLGVCLDSSIEKNDRTMPTGGATTAEKLSGAKVWVLTPGRLRPAPSQRLDWVLGARRKFLKTSAKSCILVNSGLPRTWNFLLFEIQPESWGAYCWDSLLRSLRLLRLWMPSWQLGIVVEFCQLLDAHNALQFSHRFILSSVTVIVVFLQSY